MGLETIMKILEAIVEILEAIVKILEENIIYLNWKPRSKDGSRESCGSLSETASNKGFCSPRVSPETASDR